MSHLAYACASLWLPLHLLQNPLLAGPVSSPSASHPSEAIAFCAVQLPVAWDSRSYESISIEEPTNGLLVDGEQLTSGDLWFVRDPDDAWATQETIHSIQVAIKRVNHQYPGSYRVCIGDLSGERGGPLDRHLSHQSGRDVDIGWYFVDGPRTYLESGMSSRLDVERSWALIRVLITSGGVDVILIDRAILKRLYRFASSSGGEGSWLDSVFQVAGGGSQALIRHAPGHRNHFHVRFSSPCARKRAEMMRPLLVEAGLVPGNNVIHHRARPGDSLWALSRRYRTSIHQIRQANGLTSTLIRAGHLYRIPVGRR
ncbi:MAG: LysM peptidoglycan-binding domain-containing protein [bacterium]|nr:LysM peptidoglycan-binding domain-containing protein [bacterium]